MENLVIRVLRIFGAAWFSLVACEMFKTIRTILLGWNIL